MALLNWYITNTHREISDGYVYRVEYRATAADAVYSVSTFNEVDLPRPDAALIPFQELSEDLLVQWIQDEIGGAERVAEIESELLTRLEQKQSKPATASGLPWLIPAAANKEIKLQAPMQAPESTTSDATPDPIADATELESVVDATELEQLAQGSIDSSNSTDRVLIRARNDLGQFVADDPATPEDEAWVEAPVG